LNKKLSNLQDKEGVEDINENRENEKITTQQNIKSENKYSQKPIQRKRQSLDNRPKWRCHLNVNNDHKTCIKKPFLLKANNEASKKVTKPFIKRELTISKALEHLRCISPLKTIPVSQKNNMSDDKSKKNVDPSQDLQRTPNLSEEKLHLGMKTGADSSIRTINGNIKKNELESPPKAKKCVEEIINNHEEPILCNIQKQSTENTAKEINDVSSMNSSPRSIPGRQILSQGTHHDLQNMPNESMSFCEFISPIKVVDVNAMYSIFQRNNTLDDEKDLNEDISLKLVPGDAKTDINLTSMLIKQQNENVRNQGSETFRKEITNTLEGEHDRTANNIIDSFSRDSLEPKTCKEIMQSFSSDSLEQVYNNNLVYVKTYHSTKATPAFIKNLNKLAKNPSETEILLLSKSEKPCEGGQPRVNQNQSTVVSFNRTSTPRVNQNNTLAKLRHTSTHDVRDVSGDNTAEDDDELTSEWLSSEHSDVSLLTPTHYISHVNDPRIR